MSREDETSQAVRKGIGTWEDLYSSGEYLEKHPTWDVEDSPWKAEQIHRTLLRNTLTPQTICEVGCGAGEILRQLQLRLPDYCRFHGYDVSPQAIALSQTRANERLHFTLGDFRRTQEVPYDLLLVIDVIEHLEDYLGFLRDVRSRARHTIFHIPLELSASVIVRGTPLLTAREAVGHIQYFTKDLALQALRESGYTVLDYYYTAGGTELPAKAFKTRAARLPRQLLFKLNQDVAVRLLGGYSLMVLAE